jgi:hypothetical protein
MRHRFLGLLGCCLLIGCSTAEERASRAAARAAQDDSVCQSYGATPGSDAYVQCRMVQQARRDQVLRDGAEAGRRLNEQLQEHFRPQKSGTSCTSRHTGSGTVRTDCD